MLIFDVRPSIIRKLCTRNEPQFASASSCSTITEMSTEKCRASALAGAIVALSVAVCVLAYKTIRLNDDLTQCNDDLSQRDAQIDSLSASLEKSNSECASLSERLEKTEASYQTYKYRFQNEKELYAEIKWKYGLLLDKYAFFYDNAVIKGDDGTVFFHKYGCERISSESGYWIFNTEFAFSNGYHPCVYCMKSGYYIANRSSGVYHLPTCGNLPYTRNRKYFDTCAEAENAGYRPCNSCQPY